MTDLHKAAQQAIEAWDDWFDSNFVTGYLKMHHPKKFEKSLVAITALREALAAPQPDSTAIHSCSYYCDRPDCIKAQRDELREALAKPAVPQDILNYTKGIYDFLQSVAPAGIADEAFRLPPNHTGNQRQISDFAAGDASGIVPAAARPNQGLEGQAGRDLAAKHAVPPGYALVPVEPTPEMLDVAVSHALMVSLSADYNWTAYMRDIWARMLAAAPQPKDKP